MTTEERIVVSQEGSPLKPEAIICQDVVQRILEVPPASTFKSISFVLEGSIDFSTSEITPLLSPLQYMDLATDFQEKKPDIQVRFQYDLPEKHVILLLAERRNEEKGELEGLEIRFHIQY